MNNGGATLTVNGTFDYDTTINVVSNWDLAISAPTGAPFCGMTIGVCYIFEPGAGSSATYTPDLLQFIGSSTDELNIVPGTTALPLPNGTYMLGMDSNLTTLSSGGGQAPFSSGTLSAETPEPATLPIVAAAFLLCLLIAHSQKRRPEFALNERLRAEGRNRKFA